MNSEEMEALTAEAACELNDLLRKSPKEKAKDLLKKAAGRGVRPDDPVFWPAGILLMGLAESPAPAGRAAAEKYLSEWVKDRCRVLFPDDALAGYAALRLYSSLGDGEEKEEMKKACDAVFSFLRETPKNSEGSIIYNPARGNEYIYADGAGQTALFLSEYARVFGNREAGDLAALQITNFLKHGIDDRTGLPYHAYDLSSGQYFGILGWGRAAGWLLMGMAGILGDGKTAGSLSAASGRPFLLGAYCCEGTSGHVCLRHDRLGVNKDVPFRRHGHSRENFHGKICRNTRRRAFGKVREKI